MQAILLSGGIDSLCLAYHIRPNIAYTIDYGQLAAEREIYVSKVLCDKLNIRHSIIKVDCKELGVGTLANRSNIDIAPSVEWWPFRNQLLITLASMQGVKDGISELYLASVKSDNFHKDGTTEFYERIDKLMNYQEGNIKVVCPTIKFYSHELVSNYNVPLELLSLAHSCHISNVACGKCSGCIKQLRVRHEINMN